MFLVYYVAGPKSRIKDLDEARKQSTLIVNPVWDILVGAVRGRTAKVSTHVYDRLL